MSISFRNKTAGSRTPQRAGAWRARKSRALADEDKRMSFLEHLEELRWRLIKCLLAVLVTTIGCWIGRGPILAFLLRPLYEAWSEVKGLPAPEPLHFTSLLAPFITYLKLSVIGGVFFAAPVIFYQLWRFISPGLYPKERRITVAFVLVSSLLFIGGSLLAYVFMFPTGFRFFLELATQSTGDARLAPMLMIEDYLSFAVRLLLAFGLVFELPILITFLAMAGIVDYKQLFRFSRHFIVFAFVIGAVLTPPDALTQIMMAVPLIALYFLSIAVAYAFRLKS
jgi:sec-independent protein translocase protein TatC